MTKHMTENKKLLLTLKINSFDVESWYEASDLPDVFKAYEFSNIKDAKDFFERIYNGIKF